MIDYWRIGGLVDFISRRESERQRAQRVFWSCDFAQGIAEWDWGIRESKDWWIGGLKDWWIERLVD